MPYISHLLVVSCLAWEDDGDEEQAITGLLHDAIEQADVDQASIAERYRKRVCRIVADCTDTSCWVAASGVK